MKLMINGTIEAKITREEIEVGERGRYHLIFAVKDSKEFGFMHPGIDLVHDIFTTSSGELENGWWDFSLNTERVRTEFEFVDYLRMQGHGVKQVY